MLPVSLQRTRQGLVRNCCVVPAQNHQIDAAEVGGVPAETLAHESLDPVPTNGAADVLPADREPQSRMARAVFAGQHGEVAVGGADGVSEDARELRSLEQALVAAEAASLAGVRYQADRRARPFARRAFSTRRPAFVAMRERNP